MDEHTHPTPNTMFQINHGAHILVHGGQFVQPPSEHHCYNTRDGFNHLQAHVATSAFDSVQKFDAPKCHPNTRQAVQDDIMDWILPTVMRVQWMLWLNGAAGAGKSAIARSIVALCLTRNIPIAKFFFFRTDSTRNTIQPVVATLVHQLIQQIPDLIAIIIPKIQSDPLIFTKSLETQLGYLVFDPLRQLHCECPLRSIILLLFDGVDECSGDENQTDLIRSVSNFLHSRDLPIIAFFGSRAENQLKQIFQSHEVSTNLHQLALDDHYLPDTDICLFLDDKFKQIRETHPFKQHLSETWPDSDHVQEIVGKSSGQFIYASAVINFASSPHHNPAQQLAIIRGLRPAGYLTPFAQLDALYRHIFSQVHDIDSTSFILAWTITGGAAFSPGLNIFWGKSSDEVCVWLDGTSSILVYENDKIRFLHATLPDFLLDQTRSQCYYIDKRVWCTRLSIHCFRRVSAGTLIVFYSLVYDFLPHAEGTAELRKHILALDVDRLYDLHYSLLIDYLSVIRELDFGDDGDLYRSQLNHLTRHILENPRHDETRAIPRLRKNHDISPILAQIESEKAAEQALKRTDETGRKSAALGVLHTSSDSLDHRVAAGPMVATNTANTVNQYAKVRGGKRAADCDLDVEATPRRSLRLRPQKGTPTSPAHPSNRNDAARRKGVVQVKN